MSIDDTPGMYECISQVLREALEENGDYGYAVIDTEDGIGIVCPVNGDESRLVFLVRVDPAALSIVSSDA